MEHVKWQLILYCLLVTLNTSSLVELKIAGIAQPKLFWGGWGGQSSVSDGLMPLRVADKLSVCLSSSLLWWWSSASSSISWWLCNIYTGWPKNWHNLCTPYTLSNINRFTKFFIIKIRKNAIMLLRSHHTSGGSLYYQKDEMSFVLKATIENETTCVATHFKKLTTGNNMLSSKVTVTSCSFFYIKCSMCPHCCWTTHSSH